MLGEDYANVLGAGAKTILANLGFRVANFSFDYLLRDARLRKQIVTDFASEDAAKVLLYAPELFVMHDKLDPTKGVFFVKCTTTSDAGARSVKLDEAELDTYKKFYPTQSILVIVGRHTDPVEIRAGWLNALTFRRDDRDYVASISSLPPFEVFVKKRFGMEVSSEDLKAIQTELAKLS